MLYDVFRAYGDALTVATLQGVPVTPVERHSGLQAERAQRPLRRLIAERSNSTGTWISRLVSGDGRRSPPQAHRPFVIPARGTL